MLYNSNERISTNTYTRPPFSILSIDLIYWKGRSFCGCYMVERHSICIVEFGIAEPSRVDVCQFVNWYFQDGL